MFKNYQKREWAYMYVNKLDLNGNFLQWCPSQWVSNLIC